MTLSMIRKRNKCKNPNTINLVLGFFLSSGNQSELSNKPINIQQTIII